jgi:hypothetical protein
MECGSSIFKTRSRGDAMIQQEDQESLFRLISSYVKKDVVCYAFGGTAMMYYGYKTATKDIDLLFADEDDNNTFIEAINVLGYKRMSMVSVYVEALTKEKRKPEMFTRGDERFDLFVKYVFQTIFRDEMRKRFFARHDYTMSKNTLSVFVLSKEDIIFLKSITQREKDFDDILTIVQKDNNINWDLIINEARWQSRHGDGWAIMDLEQTMQRLKNIIFLKKEYFDRLYRK